MNREYSEKLMGPGCFGGGLQSCFVSTTDIEYVFRASTNSIEPGSECDVNPDTWVEAVKSCFSPFVSGL